MPHPLLNHVQRDAVHGRIDPKAVGKLVFPREGEALIALSKTLVFARLPPCPVFVPFLHL